MRARFDLIPQLYLSPELAILITGEGMDRVLLNLGMALAKISEVEHVYNFGIAAALSKNRVKDEIISVRTAYRYLAGPMEFKSYSSCNGQAHLDCVSSFQRIQGPKEARKLSYFGDLVDRELWAVGAVCDFYRIPFESFKLISDNAWEVEPCEQIKHRALEYSCSLYQKFQAIQVVQSNQAMATDLSVPPSDLYWTESLTRQFTALSKQWQRQFPKRSIEELYTDDIKELDIPSKKKAIVLLQKIKEHLYPVNTQIRKEIEQIIGQYSSEKIKILYDQKLESTDLKVLMTISSPDDLEQCRQWPKNFPLQDIQQKILGTIEQKNQKRGKRCSIKSLWKKRWPSTSKRKRSSLDCVLQLWSMSIVMTIFGDK